MENSVHLKIIKELGNIDELPTLPSILLRLNSVLADPKSSAQDVAKLIAEDPVLTTRILKLVNSAYFGFSRQITTLTHAIVILGFREIKTMVLASKIFDFFKTSYKKVKKYFDINLLWTHSLGCAIISKNIAGRINYDEPESMFVAGLIHDIGKVVEMHCLTEYIPRIFALIEEKNISMWEAEYSLWQLTHAQIGKVMADMWDFPPMLEEVIACHHNPSQADVYGTETAIVHLANCLCRTLNVGSGGDNLIPHVDPSTWEKIGLTQAEHEQILTESLSSVSELLPVFM